MPREENDTMSTLSLGEMLRVQEACEKARCLVDLEEQASAKGPCAEHDLQLVRDFFHQAETRFTSAILARVEVKPEVLGHGQNAAVAAILQTFRWNETYNISDASHPYHGVWKPFLAWCAENDLRPEIRARQNAAGKERWYVLTVGPAPTQPQ
jgi:hypothetical protein